MTKTFVCIGAGPGIGLETARRFAREGFRVVLASREPGKLDEQVAALREEGADVVQAPLDASDGDAVTALVRSHADDLAVLLYNVAVMRFGKDLLEQSAEEIDSDIQVDLASGIRAIHAALPGLERRGGGTILLTGGGLADAPNAQALTISLGKVGLRATAQALAPVLADKNIHIASLTVNAGVAPESEHARAIAEAYWGMHSAPKSAWAPEVRYP